MSAPFSALPYYKSDPNLPGHPKIKDFAEALGIGEWEALGRWHGVLSFVSKYLWKTGNLSRYSARRIAEAAGWEGDPDVFIKAMVVAELADEVKVTSKVPYEGTLEGGFIIRGWLEWHGDVVESRETYDAQVIGGHKGWHSKHIRAGQSVAENCKVCEGTLEGTLKVGVEGSLGTIGEDSRGEQTTLGEPRS